MARLLNWIWPGTVPDWRDAWRWASTRIVLLVGFLPLIWMEMPQEAKDAVIEVIPVEWMPFITAIIGVVGAVLRIRDGDAGK